MRNIAPLALADLRPADLAGRPEPHLAWLAPCDLLVDERFQRCLSKKSETLIRAITEGWDWTKYKAPVVALTDEGPVVLDGQHTCISAACHPEIDRIPVLLVDGTDLPRRARAFVSHAVDRLQATPTQVWHAAVAGGDEGAIRVRDLLEATGITMLRRNPDGNRYRPRETRALAAIRGLVERQGTPKAREVLQALADADLAPISHDQVRAAEALLCDPEYAEDFSPERLTAALRALTPAIMAEVRELAVAKRLPVWRALAALLFRRAARRVRSRMAPRVQLDVRPHPGARRADGLGAIVMPSEALAVLVGNGPMLRSDAVDAVSKYIRANDLTDRSDRRVIVADAKLATIFGRKRFTITELDNLLAVNLRAAAA